MATDALTTSVAAPRPPRETPAAVSVVRPALLAVALYAALRALGLVVLAVMAGGEGRSIWTRLVAWDGEWYLSVVRWGYRTDLTAVPRGVAQLSPDRTTWRSDLAFFPAYPTGVRWLDVVLPGDDAAAAITLAWAAGVVAALGLFAVGRTLHDDRTGVLLAGLWAIVPSAIVESMAYSETLFTAFAAWSLHAVLHRRWLTAAVLCVGAGLTRPTGVALVAAVVLAAARAVVRGRGRFTRGGWRAWTAVVVAPLGTAGYVAWTGSVTGRPDAYTYVQRTTWGTWFDGGRFTWEEALRILTEPTSPLEHYVVLLTLVVACGLLVLVVRDRVPWPLVLYAAGVLALSAGTHGYIHAKARLLLPAFPLLLPVAVALARARWSTAVVVLALAGAVSAWYGGYLLLAWVASP